MQLHEVETSITFRRDKFEDAVSLWRRQIEARWCFGIVDLEVALMYRSVGDETEKYVYIEHVFDHVPFGTISTFSTEPLYGLDENGFEHSKESRRYIKKHPAAQLYFTVFTPEGGPEDDEYTVARGYILDPNECEHPDLMVFNHELQTRLNAGSR